MEIPELLKGVAKLNERGLMATHDPKYQLNQAGPSRLSLRKTQGDFKLTQAIQESGIFANSAVDLTFFKNWMV